jgi:hypothetical protein
MSRLQTQLSKGERHETRRVGPYIMPVDQPMKGGHGARELGWKNAQTWCMTFWTCLTSVRIERTVSTSRRSCHAPR